MQSDSYDCGDKLGHVKANMVFGFQQDEMGADLTLFLKKLIEHMSMPLLIAGRNMLDKKRAKKNGFTYLGVGR